MERNLNAKRKQNYSKTSKKTAGNRKWSRAPAGSGLLLMPMLLGFAVPCCAAVACCIRGPRFESVPELQGISECCNGQTYLDEMDISLRKKKLDIISITQREKSAWFLANPFCKMLQEAAGPS